MKARGAVKDVDGSIQEVGGAFSPTSTPESVAFEKFMVCAIPDLDKKKDIQGVLEFLAETCKKDPVAFMTSVREQCGAAGAERRQGREAGAVEDVQGQRQEVLRGGPAPAAGVGVLRQASRKGKKVLDLEEFLTAAGDYMEARGEVVQTAREEAARITDQPLPVERRSRASRARPPLPRQPRSPPKSSGGPRATAGAHARGSGCGGVRRGRREHRRGRKRPRDRIESRRSTQLKAQAILDAGGRFAEKDKREMGAFWNCVISSEVDVGMFSSARSDPAAHRERLLHAAEDVLRAPVDRVRAQDRGGAQAVGGWRPNAGRLRPPLDKYVAALPKMQAGLETYAEKLKGRGATKDVDGRSRRSAAASPPSPPPESVAFEKFMVCAIPDLDKKKDIQGVLEFLADVCKKDPVPFMASVREKCGPLVQNVNKDAKPRRRRRSRPT